jgi:hypothetical protein
MKKKFFLLLWAGIFAFSTHAQQWVNFNSTSEPSAPQVSLLTSTAQAVSFEVSIPGIYILDTVVNGTAFTRLFLPKGFAVNPSGSPEIPILTYKIAIPDCDGVAVTCSIVSQQSMPSCWVYPVPEFHLEDHEEHWDYVEQFVFDSAAYAQSHLTESTAEVTSNGTLRAQRYVEITVSPVEFCPVTRQLSVIDKVEITLTFTNPQGELRKNTGIFNKLATNTFINYPDDGTSALINDKAYKKPGFSLGNVKWITITNPNQADTISADYVIITASEFFEPNNPHSPIKRLAEHRAWYNGYAVAIVNVEHILSDAVGFYYEPTSDPSDKKARRIRTFLRRVYEGQHAPGGYGPGGDGCVAFVLLVGDSKTDNTFMPTSYDHGVRVGMYGNENGGGDLFASDYYFSCVTRDEVGTYDETGDLFIGRFSVEDGEQLYNIVNKTINHETKFDSRDAWRKSAGFTSIWSCNYQQEFRNFVGNLLDNIEWGYEFVGGQGILEIRELTLAYWNAGVAYTGYTAQPFSDDLPTSWGDNLSTSTIALRLHNDYMTPFITSIANETGRFDKGADCLGEFITRYDSIRGAVGYVGASRPTFCAHHNSITIDDLYLHESLAYNLFGDNRSIAGDLLLYSQMNSANYYPIQNAIKQVKYAYNLFGDPALNILAEPEDTTKCRRTITNIETIQNGQSEEIPADCELHFYQHGKLVVEAGGRFTVGDNVQIYGDACETDLVIHIKGGEFILGDNVTFHNINNILLENSGTFPSYDQNKQYDIENAIFENSPLTHRGAKLYVNNCSFSNRSDLITTPYSADIQNCEFWRSGVKADFVTPIIPYKNFATFVQIENCSFKNTGKYITGYGGQGDTLYSTAAIMLDAIKEFQITNNTIQNANATKDIQPPPPPPQQAPAGEGIYLNNAGMGKVNNRIISKNDISQCVTGLYVYNSKAEFKNNHIHNNIYGVRLFNNSATSFEGEPYIINGEQIITDNSSYELYASENAFPIPFIYNQIIDEDNGGNSNNDPMIYYDAPSFIPDAEIPYAACNYWGINFNPAEDWYPVGMYIVDPVWNKNGICAKGGKLYQDGKDYFANEDYSSAKSAFIELIETYPDDPYAISSLHELFALEQFIDNDYLALHDYYATFTPEDSALFNVADFLATRCNIVDRNWQPAIDWYENRIVNPPSYQDSVFAVIDLGDIHLMMEADTLGTKGKPSCYYTLAHIKPNSKAEYEENKSELLATLPKIEKPHTSHPIPQTYRKGVLGECIPNPTNGTATISYEVYKEGVIEIKIYNATGQLLQIYPQGTLKEGNYNTKVSLANVPAGIYYYTLFVNGERTDGKKLVVNK